MNTEGKHTFCAKDTYHCAQTYRYLFPPLLGSLYTGCKEQQM